MVVEDAATIAVMVQFGAILEDTKASFDESFRCHFVDYEELKRVLDRRGVTSETFSVALDGEMEKSALFACERVGHVAEGLRAGGDVASARQAMNLMLATLRFVEMNLVAVRKIVKKRDKFAARGGFLSGNRRPFWHGAPRSRHLECLESFEPQFAALLVSAQAIRESRGGARGPPPPDDGTPPSGSALPERKSINSMMGALIASGDAADARALADLIGRCEEALGHARVAKENLRLHASAMQSIGVDADSDYARTLHQQRLGPPPSRTSATYAVNPLPPTSSAAAPVPSRTATNGAPAAPHILPLVVRRRRRRPSSGVVDQCCRGLTSAVEMVCGPTWRRRRRPASLLYDDDGEDEALNGRRSASDDDDKPIRALEVSDDDEATAAETARRIALGAQCSGAALYAASCYAVVPTVHTYARVLGAPTAFAGLLLAAAPLASLASRYAMSEWCRRTRVGFKPPVILGGALCCAGNLLYCAAPRIAQYRSAVAVALFARVAVGASGGADAVNRRYIGTADLPASARGAAAARYVASDALGVAIGPLLAAFCATTLAAGGQRSHWGDSPPSITALTMPSLVLAGLWALHAVFVSNLWRESDANNGAVSPPQTNDSLCSGDSGDTGTSDGTKSGLKAAFYGAIEDDELPLVDGSRHARESRSMSMDLSSAAIFASRAALCRLFVSAVVHEILLASSAFVSDVQFNWGPESAGVFLCGLRLSALASTRRAEDLADTVDERLLALAASAVTLLAAACLLAWPYVLCTSVYAWLLGAFAAFVAAQVMSVTERALIAKIAPSSFRKLTPLVAIPARVAADLVFALAVTRNTVRSINTFLWLPTAAALAAALVTAALVLDRD